MRRAWALAVLLFPPASAAQAAWYDNAWGYRQKVTVSSTLADSTLSGFPLLVSITDPANELFLHARTDGFDLLFTDADEITKLGHEIEDYDSTAGVLHAWVRLPVLPSAGDTAVWVYYGNAAAADQQQATATWDADFQGVWHLHDDFDDSTGNSRDGVNNGSTTKPGQVADGQDFDGTADFIDLPEVCFAAGSWTLEAWIEPATPPDYDRVFFQGDSACGTRQLHLYWHSGHIEVHTATTGAPGDPQAATAAITDGVWTSIVWTFDGTTHTTYVNGASSSGATTGFGVGVTGAAFLGRRDTGNNWTGAMDEVRISDVARPAHWITSTHRNQSSPGTYQTLGAQETYPRALVKRAYRTDGTPIGHGDTIPRGTVFRFLLYVDNPAGTLVQDLSLRDVLDPSFLYQAGTMKVDDTLVSSTVCPGGVCDEDAIFAQVDGSGTGVGDGDAVNPPVDADVASYDGTDTVDFGDGQNANNARLDVPADRVWAAVLTVRMQ